MKGKTQRRREPDRVQADAVHPEDLHVEARRSERQCPLCWEPARVLGNVGCPACGARFHRECADELGGRCATLGCPGTLPTSPPPRPFLERFQGRPHRERGLLRRAWRRWVWRLRAGDRRAVSACMATAFWLAGGLLIVFLASQLGVFDFRVVLGGGIWVFVALVAVTSLARDPVR